ncbi:rRNA (cytosine-C5-)-methyltransferase nop2 [Binucleata daphniae]
MIENSYGDFLKEKIKNMFNKEEAVEFFEKSEQPRPTIIRTNTLKIRRKDLAKLLIARGMDVDPLEWCTASLVVYKSNVPIGATPEYLTGLYTIQGASSILAVKNLDPQPNEKIIDMCCAPGGKTTHIAALMQNTGTLFAYDCSKVRLKAVVSNASRLGITNTLVICQDSRKTNDSLFDRVLLDAPCSGTGIISKDANVKTKTEAEITKIVKLQKELIMKGFKNLKINGTMIYSTCSFLVEENEAVVDYLLKKKIGAKLVECENVGKNGYTSYRGEHFHPTIKLTKRLFPHVHNMDGFFIAKITKVKTEKTKSKEANTEKNEKTEETSKGSNETNNKGEVVEDKKINKQKVAKQIQNKSEKRKIEKVPSKKAKKGAKKQ